MKARGYRCVFLVILIYWIFLFQSPCWQLFGCGLCSAFPVAVPPTVLALSLGGERIPGLLESQSLPYHPMCSEVDITSSCWRPSCQVIHRGQIPDPSRMGCAGVCAHSYQNQLLSFLAQAAMLSGGIQPPEISSSGAKGVAGGSCIISE